MQSHFPTSKERRTIEETFKGLVYPATPQKRNLLNANNGSNTLDAKKFYKDGLINVPIRKKAVSQVC